MGKMKTVFMPHLARLIYKNGLNDKQIKANLKRKFGMTDEEYVERQIKEVRSHPERYYDIAYQ